MDSDEWMPVINFKLACSLEYVAIVGGSDPNSMKASSLIQIARLANIGAKLSTHTQKMQRARNEPCVAFGRENWAQMVIYGGYDDEMTFVNVVEMF